MELPTIKETEKIIENYKKFSDLTLGEQKTLVDIAESWVTVKKLWGDEK